MIGLTTIQCLRAHQALLRFVRMTAMLLAGVIILVGCATGDPFATPTPEAGATQALVTATGGSASESTPIAVVSALYSSPTAEPTAAVILTATPTASLTSDTALANASSSATPVNRVTGETRATGEVGSLEGATSQPTPSGPAVAYRPRPGVIALDPGHGGPEVGSVAPGLTEKDVNLQISLKLAQLLREAGLQPVLTRDTDRAVHPDYKGGGYSGGVGKDLQARVDIANESGAVLFLSIHNNGHGSPSESGTEVYYNNGRPFSDRNVFLARLVQRHLVDEIRGLGHPVRDRGIKDDANFRVFRGRVFNIYVLGPGTGPRQHPPTEMPGVLGESLFLTNPAEAALLRQERTIDAIARGYFKAIQAYLAEYPQ